MLKIESYTENKPKVYQIYTEYWTGSKRRPPLCKRRLFNRRGEEASSLQKTDPNSLRIERRSPLCREASPL